MELKPRIVNLENKRFLGMKLRMSVNENRTAELWKTFMPRRHEIKSAIGNDLYSLQVYPRNYFEEFEPTFEFDKWALIEVSDEKEHIEGFTPFVLGGGLYAVFDYKGLSSDPRIFKQIYFDWLPHTVYKLDNRPHFEKLGPKYKNNDPESEEEIWIPIKEISQINRIYLN